MGDSIVIVHPNWWGQLPALLTGWIDRVLRPGVAYRLLEGDGGEGVPEGLLRARTAIVFDTSNSPDERESAAFGDPLEQICGPSWPSASPQMCLCYNALLRLVSH